MSSSSLSFPNSKWKKRKRGESTIKRHKPEDNDDDYEDNDIEEDDDLHPMETTPIPIPIQNPIPNPILPIHNNNSITPYTPFENEVLSNGGTLISQFPKVIAHTVNRPHSSVLSVVSSEKSVLYGENRAQNQFFLENISHGQLQALPFVPADSSSLLPLDGGSSASAAASSSYVCTPPPIMEGQGVVKRYGNNQTHVVPMHADWFSPNSVNRLERQVVPHFFSGKSSEHTPEKYMDCRNSVVAKYMENPEKRLLVTDCQGLVPGVDLHDLNRIVRFLDHWGIINYNAPAPNRELRHGAPYLKEDQSGDLLIHSAALKSIYSLIHFDKPKSKLRPEDLCPSSMSSGDELSDLDNRIRERFSEIHCNYCSRPLPLDHYQSQKEADVMLCVDCYNDGRFVVGHSSLDFMRLNSSKDLYDFDDDSWTDQETLLLLEAIEIYNDNWHDIAEHVGSKSKAQCILHFIQLPMEDGLLENIEIPCKPIALDAPSKEDHVRPHANSNGDSAGQGHQDLDSESRLPFGNSGNPVMALVAFVSSTLGPRVASACAHASLAALSKENDHKEEKIAVPGSSSDNHSHAAPLRTESVKNAAKLGLAAAAMKAKQFADHEEREIQRMSASIINHQLRKLETKLKQFAEVETLLLKECDQVEKVRQRLASERARIKSTGFVPARPNTATIPNVAGMPNNLMNMNMNMSMNNRPVMPGQPNMTMSAYGNNPSMQSHPQMGFMPRQNMYAFGPRLPLSAIHPSSSSAGPGQSGMFNTVPGNSAGQNMGHPMLRPVSGTNTNIG